MRYLLHFFLILAVIILIPNSFAQEATVPSWIKNNAGWWASDQIPDSAFLQGVQFLIKEGIMIIPHTDASESSQSQEVPAWIKNTAGWWAEDKISEAEFVNAIEYLIKAGIINVQKQLTSQIEIEKLFEKKVDLPSDELKPYINSHGFRGSEIEKNKPDNTFRIFAVGGSTTFSVGVEDEFTWPSLLQENLNSLKTTTKIEVVNAGHAGATSYTNSKLIKTKLISFEPDLVIVYEGVNDQSCLMQEFVNANSAWTKQRILELCEVYLLDEYPFHMAERYSELCEFAQKNGFDVIISLQPAVGLEGKILTNQEIDGYFERPQYSILLDDYEKLKKTILERTHSCNAVVDLSGIFDDYDLPIYFDYHHVGKLGSSIVAENISNLVVPTLAEKNILDEKPNNLHIIKPKKYDVGQDLKNSDFSGKDLKDKNFFGADLSGSNFEGSTLTNADFRLANLENTNFVNAKIDNIKLRQNNLKNADFTNVDFSQVNLMNVDFTNVILKNSNLSNQDLTKTFFHKSDLSGADLSVSDLSFVFFKDAVLKDANLSTAVLYESDFSLALDLSGTVLFGASLTHSNLVGIDLSGKDLSAINFQNADLTDQDFTNNVTFMANDFGHANLTNANFEGVNMAPKGITEWTFNCSEIMPLPFLTTCDDPNYSMVGFTKDARSLIKILFGSQSANAIHLVSTAVDGDVLFVRTFPFSTFVGANLENSNFKNAILWNANFSGANLTNANLSGADLSNTVLVDADLTNANLDGVILSGAILDCKNHTICN